MFEKLFWIFENKIEPKTLIEEDEDFRFFINKLVKGDLLLTIIRELMYYTYPAQMDINTWAARLSEEIRNCLLFRYKEIDKI